MLAKRFLLDIYLSDADPLIRDLRNPATKFWVSYQFDCYLMSLNHSYDLLLRI